MDRPYGQDGGVVQLPLALRQDPRGEEPLRRADYSGTIFARQANVSSFWDELGGYPILRHHAYLPGTHLVMLPFHLAAPRCSGASTRVSSAPLLRMGHRARRPSSASAEGRVCAAGVAALNPLVYWHQIFGANDLGVRGPAPGRGALARESRPVACGPSWASPAPPSSWPGPSRRSSSLALARAAPSATSPPQRRGGAPRARGGGGWCSWPSSLPVAALDFRAFWRDIVGLQRRAARRRQLPFGGTPGFGFANFLLYFGRVADLRRLLPVLDLLRAPGAARLLLVRAQLRDGTGVGAGPGTTALVASLYFSRVVHPNYLIRRRPSCPWPCWPGVAARTWRSRRSPSGARGGDGGTAPFRAAWEQAVAASLPARVGGLAAALAPKAGPIAHAGSAGAPVERHAAGLGVLYLALAVWRRSPSPPAGGHGGGGGPRDRRARLVLAGIGSRTGVVRAQDPAVVQAEADGGRLLALRSPYTPPPETLPRGRQAFSEKLPAGPAGGDLSIAAASSRGPSLLAGLARAIGVRDPRLVAVSALGVLAAVAAVDSRAAALAALALVLLVGPLALGPCSGSPVALSLPRSRARGPPADGVSGWVPGCWPARRSGSTTARRSSSPFCCSPRRVGGPSGGGLPPKIGRPSGGGSGGAVVAYLLVIAPVALFVPGAFVSRLVALEASGPGLGLFNFFAFAGRRPQPPRSPSPRSRRSSSLGVVFWPLRRSWPPLALAGIASLAGIVLARPARRRLSPCPSFCWVSAAMESGPEDRHTCLVLQERTRSPTGRAGRSPRIFAPAPPVPFLPAPC